MMSFYFAKKSGFSYLNFSVGRYTGNGVAVVAALRRRGFDVERLGGTCPQSYRLTDKIEP